MARRIPVRTPRVRTVGALTAALVFAADQASKWLVLTLMTPTAVIEVAPFLNLVVVENRGVTFGLLGGGAVPAWALVVLALAIVAFLAAWLLRAAEPWVAAALGAVIGGALGNVADRLLHGAVIDFLDIHAAGWYWPAFNLADSAIVAGVALLMADAFLSPRKKL